MPVYARNLSRSKQAAGRDDVIATDAILADEPGETAMSWFTANVRAFVTCGFRAPTPRRTPAAEPSALNGSANPLRSPPITIEGALASGGDCCEC